MASNNTPGANLKGTVPMAEADQDPMDDHEAKGHFNTLMEAHHILNDPDKMARVHAVAGRHEAAVQGIKSVGDLKAVYNQKFGLGHLSNTPGPQEQNDMGGGQDSNGAGSTGNKGKPSPGMHQKSSMKQKNNLAKTDVSENGVGDDGN